MGLVILTDLVFSARPRYPVQPTSALLPFILLRLSLSLLFAPFNKITRSTPITERAIYVILQWLSEHNAPRTQKTTGVQVRIP